MASDIPSKIRQAVFDRASDVPAMVPVCEAMIRGVCEYLPTHWHHRRLRAQGGAHTVENGLAVCSACHTEIHATPERSYAQGFLVKAVDDPRTVPVCRRGGGKVYLLRNGELGVKNE